MKSKLSWHIGMGRLLNPADYHCFRSIHHYHFWVSFIIIFLKLYEKRYISWSFTILNVNVSFDKKSYVFLYSLKYITIFVKKKKNGFCSILLTCGKDRPHPSNIAARDWKYGEHKQVKLHTCNSSGPLTRGARWRNLPPA